MASPPVTFPCPFCGRRMGVPAELLGRQVRCPHCKQVVLAPVTAGQAPTPGAAPTPASVPPPTPAPVPAPAPVIQIVSPPPAPAPQPVAPPVAPQPIAPQPVAAVPQPVAPPPAPEHELPFLNIPQRKEGADSILSEPDESDDEVFGSHPGGRLQTVPPLDFSEALTPAPPPPAPAPSPVQSTAPAHAPAYIPAPTPPAPTPVVPTPAVVHPPMPAAPAFAAQPAAPAPVLPPTHPAPALAPAAYSVPAPIPAVIPQVAPVPAAIPQQVAMPQAIPAPAAVPQHASFPTAPAPAPHTAPFQAAPATAPAVAQPAAAVALAPAGDNPFSGFDAPAAPGEAAPTRGTEEEEGERPRKKKKKRDSDERDGERADKKKDDGDEREDRSPRAHGRTPAKAGGGVMLILLILVGGYAFLATAIAAYGLFFKSGDSVPQGHPLSTIPDNFGEFDPATRKKVTLYKFKVDGELDTAQRGKIGDKISVGDLVIQPEEIVKRPLTIETEGKSGEKVSKSAGIALVMRMMIKNESDLNIYPMDPAFTRRAKGDDRPITRIVLNKQTTFAGGAIQWPFGDRVKRSMEHQQANDYEPLHPGESREYIVFTDTNRQNIEAVEKSKETMQWRVQVRRSPIKYRGKEVPVTAIIGVDFTASDIKDKTEIRPGG